MGYNANDFVSSDSFMKAADLEAIGLQAAIMTVLAVDQQTFPANDKGPEQTKLVLHFDELDKSMPLNKTNTRFMMTSFGADTDGWLQKKIIVNVQMISTPTGQQKGLVLSAPAQAVVPTRPAAAPVRPAPVAAPVAATAGDPFANQ